MATVGTLIAMGKDESPREVTTRVSGTWTSPVSVTGTIEGKPHIYPQTDQLWFTVDANDDSDGWDWGTGSVSKDGGATWASTTDPLSEQGGVVHIARAADSRLWCITHSGGSTLTDTKIWYSDNDGDTWTFSIQHNSSLQQSRGFRIMPHSTNPNQIVIWGDQFHNSSGKGYILYTTDRGDNWTDNATSAAQQDQNAVLFVYNSLMTSSSRIFISGSLGGGSGKAVVKYSDDFGLNWTTVFSIGGLSERAYGLFLSDDETTVAFIHMGSLNNPRLYLSTDSGNTFNLTALDTEINAIGSTKSGVASRDTIYLGTNNEKIWQLTPVSADGIWTQIDSGFPHSNTDAQFLGVIPGIATINTFESESDGGIVFSGDSVDISVNIPPTPDPEDTIVVFSQFSATFRGSPSGAIRRLIKLG